MLFLEQKTNKKPQKNQNFLLCMVYMHFYLYEF